MFSWVGRESAAELCLFRRDTGLAAAHGEDGLLHLLTSMSMTLLLGRIRAAAPIRPVSSSAAKRIFSISWVGSTSQHRP